MDTDQDLVARCLQGDHASFTSIVNRYDRAVFNLAYRMLSNSCEAEDAAQEAFLKAYRHLHRYDPARSFKTWLLTITSNHCIDRLRRRRMAFTSLDDLFPSHPKLASHAPDPENVTSLREQRDTLLDLLNLLPDKYRTVIILHYWENLTCQEIAEILGVEEGTIKSRLYRARKQLTVHLCVEGSLSPAPA